MVLSELDPGRRRSLAGTTRLPGPVAERLADDPDAGVRARLAGRDDLDPSTVARFADPAREPSPEVWRSFASTRTGAAHAGSLLATDDRLTLLVLATNPSTPPDVLDRLAQHRDPVIAGTVAAIRTGEPPDDDVIDEVLGARAVPTRPLADAPAGTVWPGTSPATLPSPPRHPAPDRPAVPTAPPATSTAPVREPVAATPAPAQHRGLVIGFAVAALLVAGLVVAIGFGGGSGDGSTSDPDGVALAAGVSTVVTTDPGPLPSAASPSSATPSTTRGGNGDAGGEAVVLDLTMTAQSKRFCDVAEITISFAGPTAHVVITDDADRDLWVGPWDAGSSRKVDLIAPSRRLHARVTTTGDPDDFRPSGSVQGSFC